MFDFNRGEILDIKGDRYVVIQRDPDLMILVLMNAKKVEETEPFEKIPARPEPTIAKENNIGRKRRTQKNRRKADK